MKDYKVTIIVAVYNSSQFLKKGLESLEKQTWKNIEVIMVNDGSTDDSGDICDDFSKKDQRFFAIHKPNTGVCDSRNKALDIAKGNYVCFMDGDDWFSEDFVEYMLLLIEKTGAQMVFSDKLFTTLDQTQSKDDTVETWDSEKAITTMIYPYMTLGPWNKMYSMDIINKNSIRFPEHWFGETLHFACSVAYYAGKVGVGHRKVYNYRLNNITSGTTQFNVGVRLLSLENVKELKNCCFANTEKINNAIAWHLYDNYYILIQNIIATKSREKYHKEYDEATKYLKKHWINVLVQSDLKIKRRILVIVEAFFPVMLSFHRIRKQKRRIEFDKKTKAN